MPLVKHEDGEHPVFEGMLAIPGPQRSSVRRGLNSDKVADKPVSFRISEDEFKLLGVASDILGMKRSELVRWLIFFGCNEIVKQNNSL